MRTFPWDSWNKSDRIRSSVFANSHAVLEIEVSSEQVQALVQVALQEDLLYDLARCIDRLPFEARKDVQTIFSQILRFKNPNAGHGDPPVISYIVHNRPEVIVELCKGYKHSHSAMPCGTILREALKYDVVAAIILYDQSEEGEPAIRLSEVKPGTPQDGNGVFWKFFEWIDRGSFELSADAFTTFRVSSVCAPASLGVNTNPEG